MHITLLILSTFYLIVTAYLGYAAIEKLKKEDIGESERIHRYQFSIAWNCISAIFVLAVIAFTSISLDDIGFKKIAINFESPSKFIAISTLTICIRQNKDIKNFPAPS